MLRRIKFIVRTGWFGVRQKRLLNELCIPFLALLVFMALSHLAPIIIKPIIFKKRATLPNNHELVRMRTRPRPMGDPEHRTPYTGHKPYITDDITSFLINANACPGSPPLPNEKHGQTVAVKPLTFLNLIHRQSRKKERVNDMEETIARIGSDENATTHHQYDALFIVCSNVNNITNRAHFRQMYANGSNTWPYKIKVIFLVGLPRTKGFLQNISDEAGKFSDIVMGNFSDHYDNLTYKTVMGFRWIHKHCRNMDLILKLDDDVFVDVYKFFASFRSHARTQTRTINCFLNKSPRVHREGKYQVSEEEYEGKKYPPFCSGFFIVFTPDIVDSYVSLARNIRFFRLEDVFSYGLVREAMGDVQLIHLDTVTVEDSEYLRCIMRYKHKCKYMAAQVPFSALIPLMQSMACHRREMGMNGTNSEQYEL